jgi:paired small multidrug resistance pump
MQESFLAIVLTAVGFAGVGLILLAFFLLHNGRFTASSTGYAIMNISGSTGILISLIVAFNWPSFVIQICWILISLYGLARHYGIIGRANKGEKR